MKKTLIVLKVVKIIIGVALIISGLVYYINFSQLRQVYPRLQESMAILPIAAGIIIIVMQFVKIMKYAKEAKNKSTLSGAN